MAKLSSIKREITSGYALSFLLLLISYCLIFYVQQRLAREAEWVVHSYRVITNVESLKGELTDAETGLRGYVITRDTRFLKPYNEASKDIPVLYQELETLVVDNKDQASRLDTLDLLIKKRMELMRTGLEKFQTNGFTITDEMKLRRETTLNTMDSMRLFVSKFKNAEEKLMEKRKLRLSDLFTGAKIIAIISLVIACFALIYSIITFNREYKARQKADKRASKYRVDLESNKNELKEKNIELQELREMEKFTSTGRIARTIAHEVRNPLTNILLAAEQLREMENKSEESPVLLDLINRNAARINQLVSDLLNATRFTHLNFSTVNINELLDETFEMAKDRIDLNQITIEKDYPKETCELLVDKEKIKVALLNIIVNAIEAMESGKGVLQLKTKKQGNKCIIEIKDNGKGMEEEELQKLFDPYFTTKPRGNGLGLTNSQNIILNHKGKISAYSRPGRGTTFVIALEIFQDQGEENKE